MKKIVFGLLLILGLTPSLFAAESFKADALESLAIQHEGRVKSFLTFSKEAFWSITGREHLPKTGPVESVLTLLSEPKRKRIYHMRLIPISYKPLLNAIGLETQQRYFSVHEMEQNEKLLSLYKAAAAKQAQGVKTSGLDKKVLEITSRAETLGKLLRGESLRILPPLQASNGAWGSWAELSGYGPDVEKKADELFGKLKTSFLKRDQAAFDRNAREFVSYLRSLSPEYPSPQKFSLEIFYEKSNLFQKSWLFYLAGFLLCLLPATKNRFFPSLAWTGILLGFSFHTAALALRIVIGGRAPVSNMYESLIFLGWSAMVFTLIFSAIFRHRLIPAVGAFLGFLTLLIADLLPVSSNVTSLVPVLRSNYWLTIHVLTVVTSYSAFAVAMGIGHFNLGIYIFAPRKTELLETATQFLYRLLQIGVILLSVGIILGGMWANESWGRFWGWDPKETWALISLIGYLIIVHARFKGWLKEFGLAIGSLVGFLLILMTYYGVNFILGEGLHSYGFATGGITYVLGFVIFEALFMITACLRYRRV